MKLLLKSKLIFLMSLFLSLSLQGQEVYLASGINLTTYNFQSTDNLPLAFKSKTGTFYELGYKIKMMDDIMTYGIGLAINNFGASGGDEANNYDWQTTYMGLNNQLEYIIIPSNRNPVEFIGGIQMQLMQIINGKQKINGILYDLTKENEFKGVWLQPGLLFTAKYYVSDELQLSFGYNYSVGFNLSNKTEEKLKINNQQIRFGIHFNLN